MKGVPAVELWPKVHPTTPVTDLFDRLEKARSIHDIEVYKIIEIVQAQWKRAGTTRWRLRHRRTPRRQPPKHHRKPRSPAARGR